jgi:hypothetical protein
METTEIRQNKKTLIPMLALLAIGFLAGIYYIYFSGKFDNNRTMKIVYAFLSLSLAFTIFIPARKFFKNEPVLTLNNSEIIINEKGRPVSFLWPQIIDWKIEKEEDGGAHYLIIKTAEKTRKVNISWLEKSPAEIKELLSLYKGLIQ